MDALHRFTSAIKSPEELLSAQLHLVDDLKHVTKSLYDTGKCTEELTQKRIKSALSKLIIKNFDEEQIWQQVELQSKPSLSHLTKIVSTIVKNLPDKIEEELHSSTEKGNKKIKDARKPIKIIPQKSNVKPSLISTSVVDDKFFKLSELEAFLNEEDKKETNKVNKLSDEEEEDSIDYFDSLASDDDENLGQEARYKDFFDKPRDEIDDNDEDNILDKKNDDELELESNEDMLDDINSGSDEDSEGEQLDDDEEYDTRDVDDETLQDTKESSTAKVASDSESETDKSMKPETKPQENQLKSTFQKRQEKLKQKIKILEEHQLSEKPWQLKGEVTAAVRPENCLLEEHVTFDHVSRPAPVITEETTMKLEDIIKGRIKDKAWDDVERKIKPPEHPFEYRRYIALEQQKSKMSLAEVYEQEYLKKQKSEKEDNETELPAHTEIKKLMSTLFTKLDALSNFRFKPRPPQPDIKVVSNLPALTVEEVAPVSVSDATLLAPEEIKDKMKGTMKGKTERDITDRKRERRKKKLSQKMKSKKKEKAMSNRSKLGFTDKKNKQDALKKLKKKGNITIIKESEKVDGALKSSKAFFSRLQDQTDVSLSKTMKKKKQKC